MNDSRFERFANRYAEGNVPWDDDLPPPEVIELAAELAPGRALDLGCGYGRTSIYLARLGWQVDGVDFVPTAVAEAHKRASTAGVADRTRFHTGSVTRLDFLHPPYDLAIDVGCMHSLEPEELAAYHAELLRLLPSGAQFLLFARLRDPAVEPDENGPRGILLTTIEAQFGTGFELIRSAHGRTDMADGRSWGSGWFWFKRTP